MVPVAVIVSSPPTPSILIEVAPEIAIVSVVEPVTVMSEPLWVTLTVSSPLVRATDTFGTPVMVTGSSNSYLITWPSTVTLPDEGLVDVDMTVVPPSIASVSKPPGPPFTVPLSVPPAVKTNLSLLSAEPVRFVKPLNCSAPSVPLPLPVTFQIESAAGPTSVWPEPLAVRVQTFLKVSVNGPLTVPCPESKVQVAGGSGAGADAGGVAGGSGVTTVSFAAPPPPPSKVIGAATAPPVRSTFSSLSPPEPLMSRFFTTADGRFVVTPSTVTPRSVPDVPTAMVCVVDALALTAHGAWNAKLSAELLVDPAVAATLT